MKRLASISSLLLQLAVNIAFAQFQYPPNQHSAFTPGRRNLAAMVSNPQHYRSDLSAMPHETAKFQLQQYPSISTFLARGINKITLDINKVAPTTSPTLAAADNAVFGPVTIAAMMALILLGSLGQTFNEIANFLGFNTGLYIHNNPGPIQEEFGRLLDKLEATSGLDVGQTVNFATGIFISQDYAIRPDYQRTSKMLYKTDILSLDFQGNPQMAQKVINSWVSERTNKKIPLLLTESPPPHTKAILASILYFKAPWEYPFLEGNTKLRPFYTNGRKNVTNKMAQMMVNGGEFPYFKDTSLGVEIMGFPYKGGRTSMYVILPMDSNVERLKRLENTITAADIDRLVASTKLTEVIALFPKMRLENTLDLSDTLQKLGVGSLFNPYKSNLGLLTTGFEQRFKAPQASFASSFPSRIQPPPRLPQEEDDEDRLIFTRFGDQDNCAGSNSTKCLSTNNIQSLEHLRQILNSNPSNSNPGLYADQVIHKVFIDITESGTEAAAATGASINRSGGHVTFRVDMPFLFFIYHEETKVILFFGSVKTPTPIVIS